MGTPQITTQSLQTQTPDEIQVVFDAWRQELYSMAASLRRIHCHALANKMDTICAEIVEASRLIGIGFNFKGNV